MRIPDYILKLNEREELMSAMIDRLGLGQAMADLPEAERARAEASFVCFSCTRSDQCIDWLAANPKGDNAPDYCRNNDLFNAIRR